MRILSNAVRKLRPRLTQMLWMIAAWVVALNIFIFLRFGANPNAANPVDPNSPVDILDLFINVTRGGIILGIAHSLLDLIFERRAFRVMSYGKLILIKGVFYSSLFILIAYLGNFISFTIYHGYIDFALYLKHVIGVSFWPILFYISLISILINITKQIDLKFGPGNLLNLLIGRFHNPRQDHRIFMFLDLKSSTTIAERLGHIQFSRLIQDCFTDLSIVRKYKAEIYQYVGDEVVLSWSLTHGLENLNCIKAYYAFQNLLESRKGFYKKKYGLVPFFKAGLNVGDVTIAEVGQIKREIAFHGDTLNTAARIEGKCNDFQKGLLLSHTLKELIEDSEKHQINLVGEILLRGKAEALKIYSADEIKLTYPSSSKFL